MAEEPWNNPAGWACLLFGLAVAGLTVLAKLGAF